MRRITEFTDYRAFFKAWAAERPRQRTQRNLATRLDIAPSLVSMVISGQRSLALDDARRWGEAMHLSDEEVEHWVAMVRAAHGAEAEREEAELELRTRRAFGRRRSIPQGDLTLSRWYAWALLELARCSDFVADARALSIRLFPPVSVEEVEVALQGLEAVGFLVRDGEGLLRACPTPVALGPDDHEQLVAGLRTIHVEHLHHAVACAALPQERRHFLTLVAAVPQGAVADLGARVERAVLEELERARGVGELAVVVQIGLQVLPRSV